MGYLRVSGYAYHMSHEPIEIMGDTYDLMLVEPDEETRELYGDLFEEKGARVDKFSTPEEALEASGNYDAAVIEVPSTDAKYSDIIDSIDAERKVFYTAFHKKDFFPIGSDVEFIKKGQYEEMFDKAIPDDFREWVNPANWISHDLRGRINLIQGYSEMNRQREESTPEEEFVESYLDFERNLSETGEFDDQTLETMRDQSRSIGHEKALANAESTLHTLESVKWLFESNGKESQISEIFEPIASYGDIEFVDSTAEEEIKSYYGAIVGTKICDYLKHARNEDPEAEMFAEISEEEDHIKAYIGDTGSGIDDKDLESRGIGTEIIELVTKLDDARFATYTGEKVDEIEFEGEKPEDIGALFELRINK